MVLQLSAPIPIAQNITSDETLTQTKWFKSITSTYLDIFMKLIIIFLLCLQLNLCQVYIANIWPEGNTGWFIKMLASVFVILGILQFAKDAPELIKDLFNIELDINIRNVLKKILMHKEELPLQEVWEQLEFQTFITNGKIVILA